MAKFLSFKLCQECFSGAVYEIKIFASNKDDIIDLLAMNTCYKYSSGFLKKIVMLLKKEARESTPCC